MVYVPQVWVDNDATKPLSAARMTAIENGIADASVSGDLDSVSSSVNFTVPSTNVWTDIPGMSITVPAGYAWDCISWVQYTAQRNATADTTAKPLQFRVADALTGTVFYGYSITYDNFPQASMLYTDSLVNITEQDALATETVIKLQGLGANNANITYGTYSAAANLPGALLKARRR